MVQLPKNNVNTAERRKKGVEEIMQYICKQIVYKQAHKNKDDDNVVAIVHSENDDTPCIRCGVREVFYPKDLIRLAMQEVKAQGYFAWQNTDYRGVLSCWVTDTPNCPHVWYSAM